MPFFPDRIFEIYPEVYDQKGNTHLHQILERKRLNSYNKQKKILDTHYLIYDNRKVLAEFLELKEDLILTIIFREFAFSKYAIFTLNYRF